MTLIEKSTCIIEFLNHKGLGVGRTSEIVELPYTLENEIVEFERHKYRGRSETILKSIIEKSSNRQEPRCTYFGACGGCLLQHLDHSTYHDFKLNILKNSLTEKNISGNIEPMISIPFGQRRRVSMEAVKKQDFIFLGFYRFHSHQIINIDKCPAISVSLSDLINPLKDMLYKILTNGQKAQIFLNQASNGLHLIVDIKDYYLISKQNSQEIKQFCQEHNIIQLIIGANNFIRTIMYEIAVPHNKIDEVSVEIEADSFSQASALSDVILKDLMLKFLLSDKQQLRDTNIHVADLFCGRGTLTIPLSRFFTTTGFELDNRSIKALERANSDNNLSIIIRQSNLFDYPLTVESLNNYKYVVINPPRAGALLQCQNLANSKVEKIVYISCNPTSFARDTNILLQGGYKLNKIFPIDQFPFTIHLEVLGLFQRIQTN